MESKKDFLDCRLQDSLLSNAKEQSPSESTRDVECRPKLADSMEGTNAPGSAARGGKGRSNMRLLRPHGLPLLGR